MAILQKRHDYFMLHKDEFIRNYRGKNIVISEDLTVDAFDTHTDAYVFGAKKYGLGNFMIDKGIYKRSQ